MSDTEAVTLSQRRLLILQAAERLLKHYGFTKTTVADIAREAGVGVGTVYLEFPSKETIVAELALQNHRLVLERMQAAAGRRGNHATRLRHLLEERLAAFSELWQDGQHGRDLVDCRCHAVHEVHQRFCDEEEELLASLLLAGDQAGELSVPAPARLVARIILRVYDSFLSAPDPVRAPELELTHRLFLRGLLRR